MPGLKGHNIDCDCDFCCASWEAWLEEMSDQKMVAKKLKRQARLIDPDNDRVVDEVIAVLEE